MSATQAVNINNGIKNGATNGKQANGSAKSCSIATSNSNGSPTTPVGTPIFKRGFSAINANVHDMLVFILFLLRLFYCFFIF